MALFFFGGGNKVMVGSVAARGVLMAMQKVPTLVGVEGHFSGEIFPLEYGKKILVGRSRTADFSLRRTRKYRAQTDVERDKDEEAQTVSGRHFEITMYNLGSIEIRNLSPNGTLVDGKPIDTFIVDDVARNSHEIRFGEGETLKLEMRVHQEL